MKKKHSLDGGRSIPIPEFWRDPVHRQLFPEEGENASSHVESAKMAKVMHEWKHGELHSGSKKGPKVKSRAQAIAIGISEAKKAKRGGYHS